jgi:peroxiredoxin
VPYVLYRRLLSEYSTKMRTATDNAGQQKVQEWWPTALEKFTKTHPKAEDTPDALLQLAIAQEFAGKAKDAQRWYVALVDQHQDSGAAARAKGAIRRLGMKGKPFEFSAANLKGGTVNAKQFRRKVLFVVFWATWSKGHSEELPQLQALYKKYRGQRFEILGINLDDDPQAVRKFVSEHRISWPQVHQPGGMASEPAITFGIIAPSTNFLVGTDGKVMHQNVTVKELKTLVPKLLKK